MTRHSFSDTDTAITHDSDPRLLRWRLVDMPPGASGEGTEVAKLGTTPLLSHALPPSTIAPAIVGPKIGPNFFGGGDGHTTYPTIHTIYSKEAEFQLRFTPEAGWADNQTFKLPTGLGINSESSYPDESVTYEVQATAGFVPTPGYVTFDVRGCTDGDSLWAALLPLLEANNPGLTFPSASGHDGIREQRVSYRGYWDDPGPSTYWGAAGHYAELDSDVPVACYSTSWTDAGDDGGFVWLRLNLDGSPAPSITWKLTAAIIKRIALAENKLGEMDCTLLISRYFNTPELTGHTITHWQLANSDTSVPGEAAWSSNEPGNEFSLGSTLVWKLLESEAVVFEHGLSLVDGTTDSGDCSVEITDASPELELDIHLLGVATPRNYVALTLDGVLANGRLSAGSVSLTFNLLGGATVGPFVLTAEAMRVYSSTVGQGNSSMLEMPSSATGLEWDLSDIIGQRIMSIDYNVTEAFAAGEGVFQLSTGQTVRVSFDVGGETYLDIPVGRVTSGRVIAADRPTATGPHFLVGPTPNQNEIEPPQWYGWHNLSGAFDVNVYINADHLKDNIIDPAMLATQDGVSLVDNLAVYAGMRIRGATGHATQAYDPASLGVDSYIELYAQEPDQSPLLYRLESLRTPTEPEIPPFIPPTIDIGTNIYATIYLTPRDTPAVYQPALMTEPYELRLRNNVAFKFKAFGAFGEDTPPMLINCWVSQGSPGARGDNRDRLWTLCPVRIVDGTIEDTIVAMPAEIYPNGYTPAHTDNFGGTVITIPDEYAGPYNYVMFEVYYDPPSDPPFDTQTLQCTACARELR